MKKYVSGRALLDVGAGPGYLCSVAQEDGWNAIGVEVSEEAVRHGTKQFGVTYRSLDEVNEESVDALTCHHVLEHVENPDRFLETLRRKLKFGGLLVLHVPHQQPLTF